MFLAGQEVKNPLASKLASAFWPFDPGIISYYYKKSCFSNIIRVCWWYLTPYIKKREIPMYLPLSSKYTFLRWHYPNQVYGSKFWTSSQPVKQAPRFIYKIQYSSVEEKCQYQYKKYVRTYSGVRYRCHGQVVYYRSAFIERSYVFVTRSMEKCTKKQSIL